MSTQKKGFKILLANRASAKQILLAQQEIHLPRASGPVLISTPVKILSVKDQNSAKICQTWIISPHALQDLWCNIPANFLSDPCKDVGAGLFFCPLIYGRNWAIFQMANHVFFSQFLSLNSQFHRSENMLSNKGF